MYLFLFSPAEKRQNNERVLIHCAAGISRSSTITLAYLIKYENMKLDDAYSLLRSKRKMAYPNSGFWSILQTWETKHYVDNDEI